MLEIYSDFTRKLLLILVPNLYFVNILTVNPLIKNKLIKFLILGLASSLTVAF